MVKIKKFNKTYYSSEPYDEDFQNGIARVQIGTEDNARFGYINKDGEYVWFPTR